MDALLRDTLVRNAAFSWLRSVRNIHGDVVPRTVLETGFEFEGRRVPIVGPKGIFKPWALPHMPLSITTTPGGPYDDDLSDGQGHIQYRYRGEDVNHPDNVGLRQAFESQRPLVYCYRIEPGRYLVTWPVVISGDSPNTLTFQVQVDPTPLDGSKDLAKPSSRISTDKEIQRRYATVVSKVRLHQAAFRDRVLFAYGNRCSLCRLGHVSLLDAAHIIPDGDPGGTATVSNGLALCKIHHAAYDSNFLGIRPDYTVAIRGALLDEVDGPMLQHGHKEMHGAKIQGPARRDWKPSKDALEMRFEAFRAASTA